MASEACWWDTRAKRAVEGEERVCWMALTQGRIVSKREGGGGL